jgi:putative ABC transport system permease protein
MFLVRTLILLPVLLYQSLFLALSQIRASKLRSMLTTIGIVIGVASVTTVIAALTGLKTNVLSEFESFGTNKVFIFPNRPPSMRNAPFQLIRFKPELFDEMLQHCPSIKTFTRITSVNAQLVSHGDQSVENVSVAGIEPAWHDIENRFVEIGRPFSLIDNVQARPVCLINGKLRDRLQLEKDCTGQHIIIDGRRFFILGVVETRSESSMFRDGVSDSEVFVPFNTAWNSQRGRFLPFMYVVAASRSPDVSEEAQAEALFYLRKKRKIQPGKPDTFQVEFVSKFVEEFNQLATGITIVATGIVGVSLLVGGVGIMNIMLVSVSERTREIGLRKAVGARPAAILLQFLVEAVMLCLVGGLVGVLIGYGMTKGISKIPGAKLENAYIPMWAIALSFGFAAAVGLIFGMFPAIKAARLDPIEALRHE